MRHLVAEATGAFVIVFTGGAAATLGAPAALVAATSGAAAACMSLALAPMSGGHFHPSVTLAAGLAGRVGSAQVPARLAAQLVGGTLAVLSAALVGSGASSGLGGAAGRLACGGGDLAACATLSALVGALLALVHLLVGEPLERLPRELAAGTRPGAAPRAAAMGLATFAGVYLDALLGHAGWHPCSGPLAALLAPAASFVGLGVAWAAAALGAGLAAAVARGLALEPREPPRAMVVAAGLVPRPPRTHELRCEAPDPDDDAPSTLRSPRFVPAAPPALDS